MKRSVGLLFMLTLIMYGCNLPGSTVESPATQPDESTSPLVTVAPATEASIIHLTQPGELPAERAGHAGDIDSSTTANQKTAPGGDRFTFGRFERPFNADTMDTYFPYLDIVDTFIYQDDTWYYGIITLQGGDENGALAGTYGVEFELNLDGKGDWLVLADQPSSNEWTTDGVRVYKDGNSDVGGLLPMLTDDPPIFSDGFENKVFDSGMGNDPDMAWVRISPDDPLTIHIAIKREALNNDDAYMVSMWAGNEDLDPSIFDHNDHFTHTEAGAAEKGLEYFYPVKQVSELDNSCRMAVGFQPKGNEAGLCPLEEKDQGCTTPPQPCSSVLYQVWNPATCQCETTLN